MKHATPLALALTSCALLPSCGGTAQSSPPSPRPNVLLICLDTVRVDHLGFGGYEERDTSPHLDALAEESLVFTDASALSGWTKPSVPSYMTGTPPAIHGVYEGSTRGPAGVTSDVLSDASTTLAEVFQSEGYATAAFIQNAQLRKGMGFEQGFDTFVDGAGRADAIRWQGLDWLAAQEGDQPTFLYLHFLDAHWPYPVPTEYATRWTSAESIARFGGDDSKALRDAINHGEVPFNRADREALTALYDGSLRYLDDQLGLLFEDLERRGLRDNTIIAVVSDHGEEFGENGRIGHGHGLSEGLLRVPFLIHAPGDPDLSGVRLDTEVSLLDLFPTLLHAAHIQAPATHVGIDRLSEPERATAVFAEHKAKDHYKQSVRASGDKLIRTFRPAEAVAIAPFAVGQRYEAEFALSGDGGSWMATQIKPRDEDPDDAPELKGRVDDIKVLQDGSLELTVAGQRIRLAEGAERIQANAQSPPEPGLGTLVKVRGKLQDGALHATRIKLYGPATGAPPELRGTALGLSPEGDDFRAGELSLGGLTVRWSPETKLKGLDRDKSARRLDRSRLFALQAGQTEGLEIERQGAQELESKLDERFKSWSRLRLSDQSGSRLLNEAELSDLAAIGYTED